VFTTIRKDYTEAAEWVIDDNALYKSKYTHSLAANRYQGRLKTKRTVASCMLSNRPVMYTANVNDPLIRVNKDGSSKHKVYTATTRQPCLSAAVGCNGRSRRNGHLHVSACGFSKYANFTLVVNFNHPNLIQSSVVQRPPVTRIL